MIVVKSDRPGPLAKWVVVASELDAEEESAEGSVLVGCEYDSAMVDPEDATVGEKACSEIPLVLSDPIFSETSTCSISKPPLSSYTGGGVSDATEAPVALGELAGCGAVSASKLSLPLPMSSVMAMRALGGTR